MDKNWKLKIGQKIGKNGEGKKIFILGHFFAVWKIVVFNVWMCFRDVHFCKMTLLSCWIGWAGQAWGASSGRIHHWFLISSLWKVKLKSLLIGSSRKKLFGWERVFMWFLLIDILCSKITKKFSKIIISRIFQKFTISRIFQKFSKIHNFTNFSKILKNT